MLNEDKGSNLSHVTYNYLKNIVYCSKIRHIASRPFTRNVEPEKYVINLFHTKKAFSPKISKHYLLPWDSNSSQKATTL